MDLHRNSPGSTTVCPAYGLTKPSIAGLEIPSFLQTQRSISNESSKDKFYEPSKVFVTLDTAIQITGS